MDIRTQLGSDGEVLGQVASNTQNIIDPSRDFIRGKPERFPVLSAGVNGKLQEYGHPLHNIFINFKATYDITVMVES